METLAVRLKQAMAKAGLNESELARRVKLKPQTINSITRGITLRSRSMPEIADVLGVSLDWLLKGEDVTAPQSTPDQGFSEKTFDFTEPETMPSDLPIRGIVEGLNDGVKLTRHQGRDDTYSFTSRPRFLAGNRHAYAVYANGNAMSPRYENGEILLINPGLPLKPGRCVLIEQTDGTAIVRKLVAITADGFTVRTLTPDHESHLLRDNVRHIHTVVGSWDA